MLQLYNIDWNEEPRLKWELFFKLILSDMLILHFYDGNGINLTKDWFTFELVTVVSGEAVTFVTMI